MCVSLSLTLVCAQVFLTLRLDGNIKWSYATVVAPLLAWTVLTLLADIYEVSIVDSCLCLVEYRQSFTFYALL